MLESLIVRGLIRAPGDRNDFASQVAMEAVSLFDAQMREAAYQRNKEFERDLGRRQARFVVEKLVEQLEGNGSLTENVQAAGLPALVDSALGGHSAHLAMDPTPEAIGALVRDVLRKLTALAAINAGPDLERFTANRIERGIQSLRSFLGMTRSTLLDELHESAQQFHRDRWREHTARLNTELRERAAGLYTRLVLESTLRKADGLHPELAKAMREWDRVRSAGSDPAPKHHAGANGHHDHPSLPFLNPVPEPTPFKPTRRAEFARNLLLWPARVEVPASAANWTARFNCPDGRTWTMPIQNRVRYARDRRQHDIGAVLGTREMSCECLKRSRLSSNLYPVRRTSLPTRSAARVISKSRRTRRPRSWEWIPVRLAISLKSPLAAAS